MCARLAVLLLGVLLPLFSAQPAEDTWSGAERIVAVGDVHGDYDAFTSILKAAGVIDANGHWSGGKTHLVQTGDVLDRGPDSRKCMDLLMSLEKQAAEAGGAVHALIGNHEAMNMYGDLRYVSPGEYTSYRGDSAEKLREMYYEQHVKETRRNPPPEGAPVFNDAYKQKWFATHPPGYFEQRTLFASDGQYGRWIRGHNAVIKVNDIIFVHGGIGPKYAKTKIKDLNSKVARELEDFSRLQGGLVMDTEGPLWYRGLAQDPEDKLASHVNGTLERLNAKQFVVGHTVTKGMVLPRFDGKVLMIDVGLSQVYGGRSACLIIENGAEYALHRGTKVKLPANAVADLTRYLNEVGQIDRAIR